MVRAVEVFMPTVSDIPRFAEELNERRPVHEWTVVVEGDGVVLIDVEEMPFTPEEYKEWRDPALGDDPVIAARGLNRRKWSAGVVYPVDRHPVTGAYGDRRADERMVNVVVTARDSETGTGKTTLAVEMAHEWDEHGWSAEKGTLDPKEYQEMYDEVEPGAVLILDEAEQAADNRRSMSDQNLTLSHLWATMRFKQVSSIITLPTVTMLDKRLKELADYRIHVVRRGLAKVYKVKVEDTGEHQLFEKNTGWVRWGARDDDPEYRRLSEKKAERMRGYEVGGSDEEEVDVEAVRRERRNELIRSMNEEMTHKEIGEIVGLSRSAVSQIVNQ